MQMTDEFRTRPVRVFVGLRIGPEIADQLAALADQLKGTRARLVATSDIHLTLVPPWQEASPERAVGRLCRVASMFKPFLLSLCHIGYGPQPRRPNLLWVDCAATDELGALRNSLVQAFGQEETRPFRPHVTLARLREGGQNFARRYPIDKDLDLAQSVQTIELFQSPPAGATGYRVLASAELGKPQADTAADTASDFDHSRLISNSSQE